MKEVILVPEEKSVLDLLAEMKEKTKNAWIFIDLNLLKNLMNTTPNRKYSHGILCAKWIEENKNPITVELKYFGNDWWSFYHINCDEIAFGRPCYDPEKLIFLKTAK